MKRIFKIIALTLLCVIGVFGLAIGGMYLFGGFDEKIVYANNLSFSEVEKISSETIYMQVNTSTEGVTRNKLKLVASSGGERVINFPEEIEIGKPFTITPIRDENGNNVGGNVTLTAYYDAVDANLSAVARCNILVDIPVESVNVKMSSLVLKPNQLTTLFLQDNLVSTVIDVEPLNSLTPYTVSGTKQIDSFVDKKIFLELTDRNGNVIVQQEGGKNIAYFKVNNTNIKNEQRIEVNYQIKTINNKKQVVFTDSVYIQSGQEQVDINLKAYVYSTYKQQEANTVRDNDGNITSIQLNKNDSLQQEMVFTIGSYEITDMTIVANNEEVYLDEEVRIYLNNPNATGNDINLGIELATDSPNIIISDYYLIDNIYIDIDKSSYRTLKNSSEKENDDIVTVNGLSAKFDGVSTQKDEWYWLFEINSFDAYYNYKNNDETFVVTIIYNDNKNTHERKFNIIPKAYEVDSITTKYEEGSSAIKAQSGSALSFSDNNIVLNTSSLPQGVEPTFKDLEHYISYDKNYDNGTTTVNTTPTQVGKYKATFSFYITKSTSSFSIATYSTDWATLENVVFTQGVKTYTISYNNGVPQNPVVSPVGTTFDDYDTPIQVELILQIKASTTSKSLFYINTEEEIGITNTMVKFYESISNGDGVETTFSTTPYLTINKIRFYVDFDYYKDAKTDIQYLRINDKTANSDFMRVQGIGSFYITTQLVYIDENTKHVYWLGKSVDTKIDVIEVLSNLSAYQYDAKTNSYNEVFGEETISFEEGNEEEVTEYYYIFITSTTMESLKNYVIYNQINIVVKQNFGNIKVENYPGIESINANAIEFVSNWTEVFDNDKVVGYKIAYKINPISSISVDGTMISNTFNITIYVNVDENTKVCAKFILDATTGYDNPESLDVTIKDKTIQSAKIAYGTTENSEDKPLEAKAYVQNQEVLWYDINFEENLKYFFGYSDNATDGITSSMTYDITVIDSSKVVLTNLYSFEIRQTGKGGLVLKNFPVNLNESGVNQGVLLKLTVYSLGVHNFNSHYAWNTELASFVQTQNSNLSADLYIKVFGLELNIEANNPEVFGLKDEENEIQNNTGGMPLIGSDGLFKVTAKSGRGSEINIDNYAKVMSVSINNENISIDETGKIIYFQNDFLVDKYVQFIFYVGSNANRIRIKTGEDGQTNIYQTYYDQLIKSAYEIEINNSFTAPSVNQTFATITYKGASVEEANFDINTMLIISINNNISTTLSSEYGINEPIIVNNTSNLLTFKTVPVEYTAYIELNLTKKDGSNDTVTNYYTITVSPIYSNDDLTIGELNEDGSSYYITAGRENLISTANGGIVYSNELENTKANILKEDGVQIIYEDIQTNAVEVNSHMGKVVKTDELQIWSYDLNYTKNIKITLVFNYTDGGKFIYTKYLTILPNLTLQLKNNRVNSNVTSINLTNSSSYLFIKNGEEISLEMTDFVYDSLDTNYNKNTFTFDRNVLTDISSTTADDQDFLLKPVANSLQIGGITEKTIIQFRYVVVDRDYSLTYDLPIYITYVSSANYALEFNNEFNCATENQKLFTLIYSGAEEDSEVEDYSSLLTVKINNITTSLPSEYGISSPIVVDSNTNLLTFKTVPVEYTAVITATFTTLTGTSKTITQEIEITVKTIYNQSDLTLGELNDNPDDSYYFIKDGVDNIISTTNGKIVFANELQSNMADITGVNMVFCDALDENISAEYMKYSFDAGVLKLWSEDLTENKEVLVTITFTYADGGKYTFNNINLKVINV